MNNGCRIEIWQLSLKLKKNCNLTSDEENMIYAFNRLIWQGNETKIIDILNNPQKFSAQYHLSYTAQQLCTTPDRWGRTCLHQAALTLENTEKITAACISYGADVNAPDQNGRRPLHFLTNPKCIKALLSHGADIHAKDNDKKTPLNSDTIYNVTTEDPTDCSFRFYKRVQESKNLIKETKTKKAANTSSSTKHVEFCVLN